MHAALLAATALLALAGLLLLLFAFLGYIARDDYQATSAAYFVNVSSNGDGTYKVRLAYHAPDDQTVQALDVPAYRPPPSAGRAVPAVRDQLPAGVLRWDPRQPQRATLDPEVPPPLGPILLKATLGVLCLLGALALSMAPPTHGAHKRRKRRTPSREAEGEGEAADR